MLESTNAHAFLTFLVFSNPLNFDKQHRYKLMDHFNFMTNETNLFFQLASIEIVNPLKTVFSSVPGRDQG